MLRFRNKSIAVSAGFYILIAVYLLIIPFQWVAAWLLASAAHELGHCVALRICKVNIFSFYITPSGAKIQTEPMTPGCEAFAAMSGPLSGMLLLLFARYCPRVAICAIVQSVFNLLPIYPWDGGRVFRFAMASFFPNGTAVQICSWTETIILIILFIFAYVFSTYLHLGIAPFIVWLIILMKSGKIKIPCKDRRLIVQ